MSDEKIGRHVADDAVTDATVDVTTDAEKIKADGLDEENAERTD